MTELNHYILSPAKGEVATATAAKLLQSCLTLCDPRNGSPPGSPVPQFSLVAQSCLTLCDPMNCSTPGLPVHHQLPEFTDSTDAMPSSHLILCRPLLLLPLIPPSIKVFSNESTLCMRWPKYWSFSFSIIPSKEIPGLISFRMD